MPSRTLGVFAALGLAAILLASLSTTGCGRRVRHARVTPVERRVDHVAGATLVLPILSSTRVDPARPPRVVLDDGRIVAARLSWIRVEPGSGGWLPSPGQWSVHDEATGPGSWCLVAPLPADAIGQGLWLGRDRIAVNWLADLPPDVPDGQTSPWMPPPGLDAAALRPFLDADARSPLLRWRVRLLTRGLSSSPVAAPVSAGDLVPPPDALDHPTLEALAAHVEARWRTALARVWRADPALGDRLKGRLLAAVDFGAGVAAPVWPTNQESLDALLYDLLAPASTDARVRARAEDWLAEEPPAAAWILDDAGAIDGQTGLPVLVAGIANLADRAALASITAAPGAAPPELVTARPLVALELFATAAPDPDAADDGPSLVEIRLGRWSANRVARPEPVAIRPPGFRLEPFASDWTLDTWLADDSAALAAVPAAWVTSGLLLREDSPDSASAWRWSLHLECRRPRTASLAAEFVRIWLGPSRHPASVIRVNSDGPAMDPATGVMVTRAPDRWLCRVPIPQAAIGADGVVRLAVERWDSRGTRTTWPRPMLPWQTEPGRAALDTRTWTALGAARAR